MAKNYRNFRKGSRIRARRMHEAVFNGILMGFLMVGKETMGSLRL